MQNRRIKTRISIVIGCSLMGSIFPAKFTSVDHFIIIYQQLRWGIPGPIVIPVRTVITTYPSSTLIFYVNKEATYNKIFLTFAISYRTASTHSDRYIIRLAIFGLFGLCQIQFILIFRIIQDRFTSLFGTPPTLRSVSLSITDIFWCFIVVQQR